MGSSCLASRIYGLKLNMKGFEARAVFGRKGFTFQDIQHRKRKWNSLARFTE